MRAPVLILCLWLFGLAPALAEVQSIRTYDPRPFGYFVGDVIERRFEVETTADAILEPAALPRPGAVNYWLELHDVEVSSATRAGAGVHSIKLVYQTFYTPLDPRKITIPALTLTVRTAAGSEPATLPSFTFITSPIREIFPEKSGETAETFLRADPEPSLLSTRGARAWLAASGAFSLVALTLLARHLAWWPFHRRPARPFSRAARDIAHVVRAEHAGDAAYCEAILILHRAFDATAGHRLLASDAGEFLARHPEHAESAKAVAAFFEASRLAFFSGDKAGAQSVASAGNISELALCLARQERGSR